MSKTQTFYSNHDRAIASTAALNGTDGEDGSAGADGADGSPGTLARNRWINGGFDVWQRTTSGSGTDTSVVSADRIYVDAADDSAGVARNLTLAIESTAVPEGSQYGGKITTTTANTNRFAIGQKVISNEAFPLEGKSVTVSFYIRRIATLPANTTIVLAAQACSAPDTSFPKARDATAQVTLVADASALSNTGFTRYSGTFTPTTNMSHYGFTVAIRIATPVHTTKFTSGDQVYIAQIQMEIGTTPTDFNRAGNTRLGEHILCFGYYFNSGTLTMHFDGSGGGTIISPFVYPSVMRATPTITITAGGGAGTVTASYATVVSCRLVYVASAGNARDFTVTLNAEV